MNADALSTYDMSIPDAEEVEKIFNALRAMGHAVFFDTGMKIGYHSFELFRHNTVNYHGPVISLREDSPCYLGFPEINYRMYKSKYKDDFNLEFQTWGYVPLQKDYGHIIIKT